MIIVAADGSALGNPGPAGWAWFVNENCWKAGGWQEATNNQGELQAVIDLLQSTRDLEEELLILCDSRYVIDIATNWRFGWKAKGWRLASGKPVKNQQLVQALDYELAPGVRKMPVRFEWVKGHMGHELNEAADSAARRVATAYATNTEMNQDILGPGWPGLEFMCDSVTQPQLHLDGESEQSYQPAQGSLF